MKQNQYAPLSVAEMAMSLFAANEGYLDDVEVTKIVAFEAAMLASANSNHAELMATINETGSYDKEIESGLRSALDDFKANGVW